MRSLIEENTDIGDNAQTKRKGTLRLHRFTPVCSDIEERAVNVEQKNSRKKKKCQGHTETAGGKVHPVE